MLCALIGEKFQMENQENLFCENCYDENSFTFFSPH